MSGAWTVAGLEEAMPHIFWRQPQWITMADGAGFACRVCIASEGIRGDQVERLFATRNEFREHFAREHPA